MPDWSSKELLPLKQIVNSYVDFLNGKNYEHFSSNLSESVVLSRRKIVEGAKATVDWLTYLSSNGNHSGFELLDATATIYNKSESHIILYFKIKNDKIEETFIESLFLKSISNEWKIERIFGLSIDFESHKKFF